MVDGDGYDRIHICLVVGRQGRVAESQGNIHDKKGFSDHWSYPGNSINPRRVTLGAATAAGLLQGFDRVTTTRLAFFLGIPALFGAAVLQIAAHHQEIGAGVGWVATGIGTVVSFVVALVCIDWLLKFVSRHSFSVFIWYRFALGGVLLVLLLAGVIS